MKVCLIVLLAFVFGLTACTLERRHYRNGFYADFHTRQSYKGSPLKENRVDAREVDSIDTTAVAQINELVTDTISADTLFRPHSAVAEKTCENGYFVRDTVVKRSLNDSVTTDEHQRPSNPIWGVLLGIFFVALIIALIGLSFGSGSLLLLLALGIALIEELIAALLIIVRTTRKATNETEEVMIRKQRSMSLALIAIGLMVAFIIVVPMAEFIGLLLAGLSIVMMFAASIDSYRAGKAKDEAPTKKKKEERPQRPYLLAMLTGWFSILFVLTGFFLFFTGLPIGISIILLGLALVAGIYTMVRFTHYSKHRGEIPDQNAKDTTGIWLGLSLFFAVAGLLFDVVIGLLSLLFFAGMGGFN